MFSPFTFDSKRVLATLLAMSLAGQAISIATAAEQDLQQLRQQIQRIEQNLQNNSQRKSNTEKLLERNERKISDISLQLHQTQSEIKQIQQHIQQRRAQRVEILEQSQEHRQDLKTQVRAHYLMGRNHQLKLLLNQQDPGKLGRSLVYYNYFNQRRGEVLTGLDDELQRLKSLEAELHHSQNELENTQSRLQQQQRELKQQQAQQQQLVKQLNLEMSKDATHLEKLRVDEQRLSKLTNEIYQSVTQNLPGEDEQKPFNKLKGNLPWPVKGKVEKRYGSQRGNGGLRWNGMVISATEGTPVTAVSNGRVVFANWLLGYGFLIIVDHGRGYMSLYGHNRQLFKNVGESVAKGDILAQVGNSGGQDENALYFEIRHNGKTVNPQHWIAKR